jgi:hypothetical protein
VYPCCWVGAEMVEQPLDVQTPIHTVRNRLIKNTKQHFKKFTELNLNSTPIQNILSSNSWNVLSTSTPWTCVKNCKS